MSESSGGPRRGSGRPPSETRRSEPIRISVRRGELADLQAIADEWEVPLATAAWALLHSELRRLRGWAPDLGGPLAVSLARKAAATVSRPRARYDSAEEVLRGFAPSGEDGLTEVSEALSPPSGDDE